MSPQPHPDSLEDFVAGRLEASEAESVLAHLAECDACMAEAERLWIQIEPPLARQLLAEPDAETSFRMQRSLFNRIHRADLGVQTIRLGTEGFLSVIMALVRPLFGGTRTSQRQGRRRDE